MVMAAELARAQPLSAPRICCLDLDTFFVSVERLLDPTLEGKPVVVGGKPGSRGVVTAASYEVRRLGVKSGMSLVEAGKRAPNAIYLPTRHEIYGTYAERVREIARRFAPTVLVASVDEMYLDFSGCERLYGADGAASGNGGEDRTGEVAIEGAVLKLATTIFDEIGLPASAGIATSKVVAKVASALAKPRGVMLVPAGVERAVLAPLPVRSFPGIGPVAEAKLHAAGYQTLGAVAEASVADLQTIFGAWAASISRGVQGLGSGDLGRERPAFAEHDPEGETVGSISNERTFREDVTDPASIEAVLCGLCERVCWRARKRHVQGAHGHSQAALRRLPHAHALAHHDGDQLGARALSHHQRDARGGADAVAADPPARRAALEPGCVRAAPALRSQRAGRRGRRPHPRALRLCDHLAGDRARSAQQGARGIASGRDCPARPGPPPPCRSAGWCRC